MAKHYSEWKRGAYKMGDTVNHNGDTYTLKVALLNSGDLLRETERGFWVSGATKARAARAEQESREKALAQRVAEAQAQLDARQKKGLVPALRRILGLRPKAKR